MVRKPSDGSGKDDKVPATMDNQQDVFLIEGEFVVRKPMTDALTKAYGGSFLDKINEASTEGVGKNGGVIEGKSTVPKGNSQVYMEDVERVLEKSVDIATGKVKLIDVLHGILNDTYVLWVVFDGESNSSHNHENNRIPST